jgi:acetyl-CoA carboxylase biotin carboxyl carrier protein
MDLKRIEEVIKLLNQYGLESIEVEEAGFKLKVGSRSTLAGYPPLGQPIIHHVPQVPQGTSHLTTQAGAVENSPAAGPKKHKGKEVKSPFVGTFYRSPGPGSDPFVDVGKRVKKGDTLCIIEAMKLMNEIEADVDGVVAAILVDNEEPVEFDQPLFVIE